MPDDEPQGKIGGTMATQVQLRQLRIGDAMHHGVITCPPETPLRAVARMMAQHRVHCIAVFAGAESDEFEGRLWGIVSDLDLVGAIDADVDERTAGSTAATPVVTADPAETLERAAQLMREYGTAHLVVVDPASDRPVGILSTLDVAKAVAGY
jgi:CBS domain-containing protein